jgi:hypothetical protein
MADRTDSTTPSESLGAPIAGGSGGDQQRTFVGGGGFQLKPLSYTLTMPPPDDYYFVREDQLEGLTQTSRSYPLEIALAAGGAAIGFAQNLLRVLKDIYDSKTPSGVDFILAMLALALGVLATTKFLQFRGDEDSVTKIKTKIKSGQKAVVSGEGSNPEPSERPARKAPIA